MTALATILRQVITPQSVSREFPVGVQSLTVPELAARWQCPEETLRTLISNRQLRATGNRIPFSVVQKLEPAKASKMPQDVLARVSGAHAPENAPNRRQCAAASPGVAVQTPKKRRSPLSTRKPVRKEPPRR